MFTYIVTVRPNTDTEPGAFANIDFGEDGCFNFTEWTPDGSEVYEVHSEWRIDRQLDMSAGVIEYTRQED